MNFANKYRLVPFVALTKDDAKLGQAYAGLLEMLQNDQIASPVKVALLEQTLGNIQRFKENISQVQCENLFAVIEPPSESKKMEVKVEKIEEPIPQEQVKDELETTQYQTPEKMEEADEATNGPWTPVQRREKKKRSEATPRATPPSTKKTRSGKEYGSVRKPSLWSLYN